jgi:hypothetical protein
MVRNRETVEVIGPPGRIAIDLKDLPSYKRKGFKEVKKEKVKKTAKKPDKG